MNKPTTFKKLTIFAGLILAGTTGALGSTTARALAQDRIDDQDKEFIVSSQNYELEGTKIEVLQSQFSADDEEAALEAFAGLIYREGKTVRPAHVEVGQIQVVAQNRGVAADDDVASRFQQKLEAKGVKTNLALRMKLKLSEVQQAAKRLGMKVEGILTKKVWRVTLARITTIGGLSISAAYFIDHATIAELMGTIAGVGLGCSATALSSPVLEVFQNEAHFYRLFPRWHRAIKAASAEAARTGKIVWTKFGHSLVNFGVIEVLFTMAIKTLQIVVTNSWEGIHDYDLWTILLSKLNTPEYKVAVTASLSSQGLWMFALGQYKASLKARGYSPKEIGLRIRWMDAQGSVPSVFGFIVYDSFSKWAGGGALSILTMAAIKKIAKYSNELKGLQAVQQMTPQEYAAAWTKFMPCGEIYLPQDQTRSHPQWLLDHAIKLQKQKALELKQPINGRLPVWLAPHEQVITYETVLNELQAEEAARNQPALPVEEPRFRVNPQAGTYEPLNDAARELLKNSENPDLGALDLNAAATDRAA